jgi:hypothetical protein
MCNKNNSGPVAVIVGRRLKLKSQHGPCPCLQSAGLSLCMRLRLRCSGISLKWPTRNTRTCSVQRAACSVQRAACRYSGTGVAAVSLAGLLLSSSWPLGCKNDEHVHKGEVPLGAIGGKQRRVATSSVGLRRTSTFKKEANQGQMRPVLILRQRQSTSSLGWGCFSVLLSTRGPLTRAASASASTSMAFFTGIALSKSCMVSTLFTTAANVRKGDEAPSSLLLRFSHRFVLPIILPIHLAVTWSPGMLLWHSCGNKTGSLHLHHKADCNHEATVRVEKNPSSCAINNQMLQRAYYHGPLQQ